MNANAMTKTLSRTFVAALLIGLAASGCARREAEDDVLVAADAAAAADGAAAPTADAAPSPPPPQVGAVRIEVTLSPAAQEKLSATGETVKIEVSYGGDPAPGASLQPNMMGMVELGRKTLELGSTGTVDLPESEIDKSRLDQIVGQPQLMLNAMSSGPVNLLACGFYWDTLGTAVRDGAKVHCSLLSEAQGGN